MGSSEIYYELKPILKNNYRPIKKQKQKDVTAFQNLPINITSFGEVKNNLSITTKTLEDWFSIKDDPSWYLVTQGVNAILNEYLGTITRYVALVSEIETLMKILKHKNCLLDVLINNYAEQWKDELSNILIDRGKEESLGSYLKEIRNVITHPIAANKGDGKYWSIARNPFHLQKAYAYLAGFFIKAILEKLGTIPEENIEKYVDRFIRYRASWTKTEYI